MRLLDQVVQAQRPLMAIGKHGELVLLPGPDAIAKAVRDTPLRYILSDDLTAACARLAYGDDRFLKDCMDIVRVPAESVWIEWREYARRGAVDGPPGDPQQRVGMLVTAESGGRKGSIRSCWTGEDPDAPDLCAFTIEFDLDDDRFHLGCDAFLLCGSPVLTPSALAVLECVRFRLDPKWRNYYREGLSNDDYLPAVRQAAAAVLGDAAFALAFSLLLGARGATEQRSSNLRKLNEVRTKRGKPRLLDHIEVSSSLFHGRPAAADYGRANAGPRLHHVRGHFVRRLDKIFWRSPHLRGGAFGGVVATRTVALRLEAA